MAELDIGFIVVVKKNATGPRIFRRVRGGGGGCNDFVVDIKWIKKKTIFIIRTTESIYGRGVKGEGESMLE